MPPPLPSKSWVKLPRDLTFTHVITVALFLSGAAYSAGRVHADLDAHQSSEGHPALAKRVHQNEVTLARVAAVLELLEKRK